MRASHLVAVFLVVGCAACGTSREPPIHQEPTLDALPGHDAGPSGPTLAESQRAILDRYLDAQFASHAWPSLAIGVVLEDALVYSRGFGARDGKETGAKVDEHTVFRIGSVTKVITGAAVLQRRDRKLLDLDDPVDRHVPELASLVSPEGQPKVTVRHLVTHTSGIPSLGDGTARYWTGDHDLTESELFAALKGSKLEFTPGTRVAYSNFAVALAGIIVARVSGEPFRDTMEGSLFAPLKMTESAWDRATVDDRLARGHSLTALGYGAAGPHWRLGAAEPAGGLYSTVSDVARFLAFQGRAHSDLDDLDEVLDRASLRESQHADTTLPAAAARFGVNWLIGQNDLGRFVAHNGSVGDYSASVQLYPERRAAVVALLSTGNSEQLDCVAHAALGSLFRDAEPAACAPSLTSWNAAALARVKALITTPDAAAVDEAFSPSFLASTSRDELLKLFEDAHGALGGCSESSVLATADNGAARVQLSCAKGNANVLLAADPATSKLELLSLAAAK